MPQPSKPILLLAALLVAATFVAYLPALDGGLIWDDDAHVTKTQLRSLAGLGRIWGDPRATQQYYPVSHSVFWLQARLWGDHTLGYHLVNLTLHCTSALMVWRLLVLLEIPGAFLAAGAFALHPVHVESVAWISELKNTLSGAFYYAALLAYFRFHPPRATPAQPVRRAVAPASPWPFYFLALFLFILGLLSKTVIASLPAALLLLYWWKRGRLDWRRDVLPLVPFFVVGAGLGLMTAWFEKHYIGASGQQFAFTPVDRLLIAGRVAWFYCAKLLWPANLIFIYPRWTIDAGVWRQYLFPLAALATCLALWFLRRRIGRGPLTAVLFFGGTLFPALGFFNVYPFVYSFVADHFQYLASLGVLTLGAALVTVALRRIDAWGRPTGHAVCVLLLGTLALLTWRRAQAFTGIAAIYRDTLSKNPNCSMAHNNYGTYLRNHGQKAQALQQFEMAVTADPRNPIALCNVGINLLDAGRTEQAIAHLLQAVALNPYGVDGHKALGLAMLRTRQYDKAQAYARNAIKLSPTDAGAYSLYGSALLESGQADAALPQFKKALSLSNHEPQSIFEIAHALELQGQTEQAISYYQQALMVLPQMVEAHINLGNLLLKSGQGEEAMAHFHQAIQIQPDLAEAYNGLGSALLKTGQAVAAAVQFRTAVDLKPTFVEAHFNLANALAAVDQPQQAIPEYATCLRLQPDHIQARHNLGSLLFLKGDLTGAAAQYQQVLQRDPDYADAHFNLAQVLDEQGRRNEAEEHYRKNLTLRPNHPEGHYLLGLNLWRQGRSAQAIQELRQALALRPGWPEATADLARIQASGKAPAP